MSMRFMALVTGILLLGGCAAHEKDIALLTKYPGIQEQMTSYYDDHAAEGDWSCGLVQMDVITRVQQVRESDTSITFATNYDFAPFEGGPGGRGGMCHGFHTRLFTFDKTPDGLVLTKMTGEQK